MGPCSYTSSTILSTCWTIVAHLEIVFESHVLVKVASMRSLEIALVTSEAKNKLVRVLM